MGRPAAPIIPVGTRFGKLTVVSVVEIKPKAKYSCACDCGGHKIAVGNSLRYGYVVSCGCVQKAMFSARAKDMAISNRKEPGHRSYAALMESCRNSARKRDLVFELDIAQFKEIVSKDCYLCGGPPSPFNFYLKCDGSLGNRKRQAPEETIKRSWIFVNGIDRFDSNLGYTISNCRPCCYLCNVGKAEESASSFIEHCKSVVEFNKIKAA